MVLTRQGFLGYQIDTQELLSAVIRRIQSHFPLTYQQLMQLLAIANNPLSHIDRLRERIDHLRITSKEHLLELCRRYDSCGEDALQIATCALSLNGVLTANPRNFRG